MENIESLNNTIEDLIYKLKTDQSLKNYYIESCKPKVPLDVYFRSHNDVNHLTENKRYEKSLGLITPPLVSSGLQRYFCTLSISPKQRMKLNKRMNSCWGDYKLVEQFTIFNRIKLLFNDISKEYVIYYELTKQGNLHIHCVVDCNDTNAKDLRIDIQRFFGIHDFAFCDVRKCIDGTDDKLKDYLTNKKDKNYQTSGIKPYYSNPQSPNLL